MDNLTRNIASLERDLQLSHTNPTKIIAVCIIVGILFVVLGVWWTRPSALLEKDNNISWIKLGQFILAVAIALLSILWILWNMYVYN